MSFKHTYTFHTPDGAIVKGIRHRNPDGSVGGWVAQDAEIAASAYVDPGAIVEPQAKVEKDAFVPRGKIVRYKGIFP